VESTTNETESAYALAGERKFLKILLIIFSGTLFYKCLILKKQASNLVFALALALHKEGSSLQGNGVVIYGCMECCKAIISAIPSHVQAYLLYASGTNRATCYC
jgi:hypothetical protein